MKCKYLCVILIVVTLVAISYNVFQSKSKVELSDFALDNIEALATGEVGGGMGICYRTVGYSHFVPSVLIFYCYGCTWVNAVTYQDISVCY